MTTPASLSAEPSPRSSRTRDPVLHRAHAASWIARNPEKRRAHHDVRNAIRRGDLQRGLCHCGEIGEAHHHDYSKPLDVVWLCRRHHAAEHAGPSGPSQAEERDA